MPVHVLQSATYQKRTVINGANSGVITLALAIDNAVHFYKFKAVGNRNRYFVIKGSFIQNGIG